MSGSPPGRLRCAHGTAAYNGRMSFHAIPLAGTKPEQYAQLLEQVRALMHGERDRIANWCGFYLYEGTELVVGPFQGLPACIRIPLDQGVCGAAATSRQTQVVRDVNAFDGHIACDSASQSECVVPLVAGDGTLLGVLDLDSPRLARFDEDDARGLEAIGRAWVEAVQ